MFHCKPKSKDNIEIIIHSHLDNILYNTKDIVVITLECMYCHNLIDKCSCKKCKKCDKKIQECKGCL